MWKYQQKELTKVSVPLRLKPFHIGEQDQRHEALAKKTLEPEIQQDDRVTLQLPLISSRELKTMHWQSSDLVQT